MSAEIVLERQDGVATLTLNRPQVKNALTVAMCRELIELFAALQRDNATRVLIMRGAGTDFCTGADLKEMATTPDPVAATRSAAIMKQVKELSWPLFRAYHELPQAVLASARGHAVGAGAQFLFAADLVVASDTLRISVPQVKLGHNVDHGESWYLPRKIGVSRAMQVSLLGDAIDAADAEKFGIVNWLAPDQALDARTADIAARLAAVAPIALGETKCLMRESFARTYAEQFDAEARSIGVCTSSDDFVEAMSAAVAKRKPNFKGRDAAR